MSGVGSSDRAAQAHAQSGVASCVVGHNILFIHDATIYKWKSRIEHGDRRLFFLGIDNNKRCLAQGRLVDRASFQRSPESQSVAIGVAALAPAATPRACEQQVAVQPPCDTLRLSVLAQPSTCEAHHRPQQRILFRRSSPHDLPVAANLSPPCRRVRRVPATPARRAWARTAGGPGPAGRAPRSRLSAPLSWSHTAGGRLEAARRVQVGYRARHGRS